MGHSDIKTNPRFWFALAIAVIVLDQWSKSWVTAHFYYGEVRPLMDFFNLVLVHNTGAAFSFLSEAGGWQRWFFGLLAAGVSIGLIIWLMRLPRDQKLLSCALSLILGGAVGNLLDRVMLGYVVDFIDIYYQNYHWPAFNVADSAISVGAVLMVIDTFISKKEVDSK